MPRLEDSDEGDQHLCLLMTQDRDGRVIWRHRGQQVPGKAVAAFLELSIRQHLGTAHVGRASPAPDAPLVNLGDQIHTLETLVHESRGRKIALAVEQDQGRYDQKVVRREQHYTPDGATEAGHDRSHQAFDPHISTPSGSRERRGPC